ncbi:hypothetical protein [Campylobacter concisus]|jgi:hypothetical protein|uniref:hypothetical protein n=1 Tax=Campylobacter concisus TaxID=199 RepID=UPI000CD82FD5|nr:hypothetical protein [Campylobacter concisus]
MRILLVLISALVLANAKCYKAPCQGQIEQSKTEAITAVEQAYAKNQEALNKLEMKYQEYNEALAQQNELLRKIQNVKADTLLFEKQISHFLTQGLEIRDKNIDIRYEKAAENGGESSK